MENKPNPPKQPVPTSLAGQTSNQPIDPTLKLETGLRKAPLVTKFIIFTIIGGVFSLGAFLITFITTQKASTPHPYANLKLVIPTPPTLPDVSPILLPSLITSPVAEIIFPEEELTEPLATESATSSAE